MAMTLSLFYTTPHPAHGERRRRKRVPLSRASGEMSSKGSAEFCVVKNHMWIIHFSSTPWCHCCSCYVWFCSFAVSSYCFYFNPWSLAFVSPVLLPIPPQEQGDSEQRVVWSVSVGTLHWGIPLLNHDKPWENIQSRTMEMMKSLERKVYEEQLKSLGLIWRRRGWGDCRKGGSELSTASWQRRECTHQKLEFFGISPVAGLLQSTSEAGQVRC